MAATTEDLERFVRDALLHGQSRDSIAAVLASAGWPAENVRSALDAYAPVDFPVPVPRPKAQLSAREAFVYLVLFITLYVSAWHLGNLLFELINQAFPDAADRQFRLQRAGESVRWSVASILTAFPVFLLVARQLGREIARDPVKRLSNVRRTLTYLTLFIAVAVLVGDVITLVYTVLGGEFTLRFGLKVLVAAIIAGTVFGYFLHDLQREEGESAGAPRPATALGRNLAIVAGVVMATTIVAAILATGTPGERRQVRLDERRVDDLQALGHAIDRYHAQHRVMPGALSALAALPGNTLALVDPETGAPYVYLPASERRYQLCASFTTDTGVTRAADDPDWQHGIGQHCFARRADKLD
jgi:hypothetical protein